MQARYRRCPEDGALELGRHGQRRSVPAAMTARRAPADMIERTDAADRIDHALAAEPIEPIEANDPMEPIDSTLPTEPMERMEFRLPILRIDRSDFHDHRERRSTQ